MKILHIISSGGMYGAEAVILNLSRTLNETGHSSSLGVFSNSANSNHQLHEAAAHAGIESHLIPCQGQVDHKVPGRIRDLARRTGADVVHAHGYKADIYTWFALGNSHIPLISTCHNWLDTNSLVRFYGVLDRFALRNYTAVVSVSDDVTKRLLDSGVPEDQIVKIGNGVNLKQFEGISPSLRAQHEPEHDLIVGWVGRLAHEKGADIFLRAVAQSLNQLQDVKFFVIGEGPDRDKLESLADELGIRTQLSFLGRREDMPSVYASLDIAVSSSRQEGLPMAILEGMASGLPWIATDVGDVSTVILNDDTGLLIPSENIDLLSKALIGLSQDANRRKRLGSAASKLVIERFSAERMTADYLQVYEHSLRRIPRKMRSI
jgi:glycosyltransferase involved in cell wall biosynthesis